MRRTLARYIPFAVLVALAVAVQVVLSALKVEFYLTQLTMAAYYTLVAMGLCLLMGYAGQVSLGHAGFFTIGGYTSAVLTTVNLTASGVAAGAGASAAAAGAAAGSGALLGLLSRLGILVPGTDAYGAQTLTVLPWAAFAAALLLTVVVAVLVGIPVLRLRGHYLAMATLAFGVIVARVAVGTRLFGEADGISDVPVFKLFAGLAISGRKALRVQNYYIAWAAVAAGFLLLINLIGSRAGRALRAIHGDEAAASAMGVDVPRHKLAAFVLSALYAAVGGACLVHFNGGIGPGEASVLKSVRYVALVAAGGMGSAGGVLAVSTILTFLSLRGAFGQLDDAVFGAILVAIMLFAPDGVFAPAREWFLRALRGGSGAKGAVR